MLETLFLKAAAEAGAAKLTEKLIDKVNLPGLFADTASKASFKNAITDHFEITFDKCASIKTILRDKREPFYQIYSSQGFIIDEKRVDQNTLSSYIKSNNKSIVLQGSGGSGKSMFFRYLWLSYFAKYNDKIPILIELRNLNSMTSNNLSDYIYHTILKSSSSFSRSIFDSSLKKGDFILFLDGFDEINYNLRDSMQQAVLDLKDDNKHLQIIISSREDERFSGWHRFDIVKMAPLTIDECKDVIKKAPFNPTDIRKLLKRVDEGLYESHNSFLSNPLLTYMTLVTFAYNPNFSDRMYEFYELAFDALYYRHDLAKDGGYVRKFYTGFNKHKFQRILSYFCLITYYDEAFEFSAEKLNDYIYKAKIIEKNEFGEMDNDDFIRDIMESVCLIKKEGIEFAFTHRKLQEYFAAYCIGRVASRNLDKLFRKFAHRYSDDVLGLVYDLNPDLFREKYVQPISKNYRPFFKLKKENTIKSRYAELTESSFYAVFHKIYRRTNEGRRTRGNSTVIIIRYKGSGDLYNFYQNSSRVWESYYSDMKTTSKDREVDDKLFGQFASKIDDKVNALELSFPNGKPKLFYNRDDISELLPAPFDITWEDLSETLINEFLHCCSSNLHAFVNTEINSYNSVTGGFTEFFGD